MFFLQLDIVWNIFCICVEKCKQDRPSSARIMTTIFSSDGRSYTKKQVPMRIPKSVYFLLFYLNNMIFAQSVRYIS